jgi:hypothetical protein
MANSRTGFTSLLQGVNQVIILLERLEKGLGPVERIFIRLIGLGALAHHFGLATLVQHLLSHHI